MEGTDIELYKRLRLVRKKLRQIDELLADEKNGKELNDEQKVKISTHADLQRELKTLSSIAEGLERQRAAAEEQQVQEEVEGAAEGPVDGAEEAEGAEGAEGAESADAQSSQSPVEEQIAHSEPPTPGPAQSPDVAPKAQVAKKKQTTDQDGWTVVGGVSKIAKSEAPMQEALRQSKSQQTPVPHQARPPAIAQSPAQQPIREEVKDPRTEALEGLKKGWRNATFTQSFVEGHRTAVSCIKIIGDKILSGGFDSTVKEWDFSSGKLLKSFGGHTSCVRAVAGTPKIYYSAGEDSNLMVWEAKTGKCLRNIYCFAPIRSMDAIGSQVVTGHSDCTVRIYEGGETGSEDPKVVLRGHASPLISVAVYNNGSKIMSSDQGGTVMVWNTNTETTEISFTHPDGLAARQTHWDQTRKIVVAAHGTDSLTIWDEPFDKPTKRLEGYQATEGLSCFNYDPSLMLHTTVTPTGSGAIKVYLWAVKEHLFTIAPEDTDAATCMDKAGDRIVVGGLDGWITILQAVENKPSQDVEMARVITPVKETKQKKAKSAGNKNKSKGSKQQSGQSSGTLKGQMSKGQMIGSAIGIIGAVVFALVAVFVTFDRSIFNKYTKAL